MGNQFKLYNMKKLTIVLLFLVCPFLIGTAPAQQILNFSFPTPSLKESGSFMSLYLPPGYDEESDQAYPLIIYLHGSHPNDNLFISNVVEPAINELIMFSGLQPVIIAMPRLQNTSNTENYDNHHMYVNSEYYGGFEDVITHDLMGFLRDLESMNIKDKISFSRESTAIIGFSMGGGGAARVALKNPDLFGAFGSHSGDLSYEESKVELWLHDLTTTYCDGACDFDFSDWQVVQFMGISAALNDLDNGAIQFILDEQGNLRREILEVWQKRADPAILISENELFTEEQNSFHMYIEVNSTDVFGLTPLNRVFAGNDPNAATEHTLQGNGVDEEWYTYHETPGMSHRLTTDRAKKGLAWIIPKLSTTTSVHDFTDKINYRVYPNPTARANKINVTFDRIEDNSDLKLDIIDMGSGKKVHTYPIGSTGEGQTAITVDVADIPPGVYSFETRSDSWRAVRKVIITK